MKTINAQWYDDNGAGGADTFTNVEDFLIRCRIVAQAEGLGPNGQMMRDYLARAKATWMVVKNTETDFEDIKPAVPYGSSIRLTTDA